ncbi:MAG: 2TM domain-containing protein [Acidimicrobiia bacterium]|nr:2TM domain-containing protein [Acidimicrobiia bacterium]
MTDSAMERARKRAKDLREFYVHLATYVVVCGFLVAIDLIDDSTADTFIGLNWAYWPIMGWGIAVAIHAFSVFFAKGGWEERKAEELYEKERQRELLHH